MKEVIKDEKRIGGLTGLIYAKFRSQTECAKALGWQKQKLSRIVNGVSKPDVDDVNALANVFDKPVNEITEFWVKQ